ncbi:class I SAM-dependent methyltransferase [Actinocrispum wychmicini]|uniref:Methyltransferase family protein n=1 Tax=Actinocrispum wychmicini TaxID=1213861 RepID=A0A4R2J836_9PSEU|nr:class I SAM-dependent methyltransferase [Actinocrispum wychmicini]TCO54367.1 methyltransferase family protein [Actinocrispum wychmicini]
MSQDLDSFRTFELSRWRRVVDRYHLGWGDLTRQAGESLLDLVGVAAGTRLLDVATGPGYVASGASGRGGGVIGIDFSGPMVEKAKNLFPALDFREGDAEDLAFEDGTFDRVTMNFGILHLGDPERAVREAYRVLAPNGRFGFTAWASPEKTVGFSLLSDAVMEFGEPVDTPEGPDFYHYSSPEKCGSVLTAAGFAVTHTGELNLAWRLADIDELFPAYLHGTVRTGALLAGQDESARAKIEERVRETASQFKGVNGEIVIPMSAVVAWGEKH